MHTACAAVRLGHRTFENPIWQWRIAQRFARVDVFLDPVGHLEPAGLLPQLKRPLLDAKAPAHGKVNIACGFGNAVQMDRGVVKLVAQNGPQKARLGAFGIAQQVQPLACFFLQHAPDHFIGLLARCHIVALTPVGCCVKPQDVAANLFVKAAIGFLPQCTHADQLGQHGRCGKAAVERIRL